MKHQMQNRARARVLIRGAGDLATGVAQAFYRAGVELLLLECARPTAIRRSVALSEAVYDGFAQVEDLRCRRIETLDEISLAQMNGEIPLLVDPSGEKGRAWRPDAVIDAILAKRNLGTNRSWAPLTLALGPGFTAGKEVDAVIETMRGHDLGRLILTGEALPNTGIPAELGGRSAERVLHAPVAGRITLLKEIGALVQAGEALCRVAETEVCALFPGRVRGLIRDALEVPAGMKIADVDPRSDVAWQGISDKARSLGGAALTAWLMLDGRLRA